MMDIAGISALAFTLLKDGAWMPLAVLVIGVLVWLMLRAQKEQTAANREDAQKREAKLMAFVDENKAEALAREDRLMEHLTKTEEVQTRIVSTLERMEMRMQYIERAVNIEIKYGDDAA